MDKKLEIDLQECQKLLDPNWQTQSNSLDKQTNFIYNMQSLQECLDEILKRGVDQDYVLHRWYNFKTSQYCEEIFCDYGAIHHEDNRDHEIDIYIDGRPYDVKLTVYPQALNDRPYDLTTRSGKNKMIEWFYANQSQESRKQLLNRIYVVCDSDDARVRLAMKSDFDILRRKIRAFMEYSLQNGVNRITIIDDGKAYCLQSDIVNVSYL